jgi:digalactosyldiacylglycerol synthase
MTDSREKKNDNNADNATHQKVEMFSPSDLSQPNRHIWVITSAALPWMTGTAVNPLLRALYCARIFTESKVTLVIPWLTRREDREKLFGPKNCDNCPFDDASEGGQEQQTKYIRHFAKERCNFEDEEVKRLRILFYDAVYFEPMGSIFPTQDICSTLVPDDSPNEADIAILEEPEHMNWIPSSDSGDTPPPYKRGLFKEKFRYVVGIIHTNYPSYAATDTPGGPVASFFANPSLTVYCGLLVRAHCHRVIRLSGIIPDYAHGREVTENVHGVRQEFIKVESQEKIANADGEAPEAHEKTGDEKDYSDIYFVGKLLWAKGFKFMLNIEDDYYRQHGKFFAIDVYGGGPDEKEIKCGSFGIFDSKDDEEEDGDNKKNRDKEKGQKLDENGESRTQKQKEEHAAYLMGLNQIFESQDSLRSWLEHDDNDTDKSLKANVKKLLPSTDGPFNILKSLAASTVDTGVKTTKAVYSLGEKTVKTVRDVALGKDTKNKKKVHQVPAREKEPIPARFLGVKNHVLVKDMPHKIFLNPSKSEVLCTTSAEALAMGKFVILPKHSSNEFFYDFPNCLPYETNTECIEHINFALEHDPVPMTKDVAHIFTWEAATDRLVEASKMSQKDANEYFGSGRKFLDVNVDDQITRMLSESKQRADGLRRMLNL